jgi:hypothetical protein
MRARNMTTLTVDIKAWRPGVVIWGIGNDDHQDHPSDHNEDDTPGSRPEQTDADDDPEHRAIDVMLGSAFSRDDAWDLVNALLADPAALARLVYIIFEDWIWSKRYGWARRAYSGTRHGDHVHLSGDADDDENAAHWPAVTEIGDGMNPYIQHVMNYRLEAVISLREVVKVTAFTFGGKSYPAFSEPNVLALTLKAQNNPDVDEVALAAALAPIVRDIFADLEAENPSDGLTEEQVSEAIENALNRARISVSPAAPIA